MHLLHHAREDLTEPSFEISEHDVETTLNDEFQTLDEEIEVQKKIKN